MAPTHQIIYFIKKIRIWYKIYHGVLNCIQKFYYSVFTKHLWPTLVRSSTGTLSMFIFVSSLKDEILGWVWNQCKHRRTIKIPIHNWTALIELISAYNVYWKHFMILWVVIYDFIVNRFSITLVTAKIWMFFT